MEVVVRRESDLERKTTQALSIDQYLDTQIKSLAVRNRILLSLDSDNILPLFFLWDFLYPF